MRFNYLHQNLFKSNRFPIYIKSRRRYMNQSMNHDIGGQPKDISTHVNWLKILINIYINNIIFIILKPYYNTDSFRCCSIY